MARRFLPACSNKYLQIFDNLGLLIKEQENIGVGYIKSRFFLCFLKLIGLRKALRAIKDQSFRSLL